MSANLRQVTQRLNEELQSETLTSSTLLEPMMGLWRDKEMCGYPNWVGGIRHDLKEALGVAVEATERIKSHLEEEAESTVVCFTVQHVDGESAAPTKDETALMKTKASRRTKRSCWGRNATTEVEPLFLQSFAVARELSAAMDRPEIRTATGSQAGMQASLADELSLLLLATCKAVKYRKENDEWNKEWCEIWTGGQKSRESGA